MKQAPAGSFAVWFSCLLQREGLPFVDAAVWGFWGNWFLYLPDLLGGDLLCTSVQAVELSGKSMPRGWVGFFSLPGLFSMCGLTRGQPANAASRATPNFAQFICLNPWAPHLHWQWGAGKDHEMGASHQQMMTWIIPQNSSRSRAEPEPAPLNRNPTFHTLQELPFGTGSNRPPWVAFSNRQQLWQQREDKWERASLKNKLTQIGHIQ